MRLSLILLCLVVLLMTTAASAYEIVVAPDGPVKTLLEARDAARAYKAAHPDERVTITLRAGYYFLDKPVSFGPEDSGLTVQGKAGETATLGSGRKITGWRKLDDHLWCADVPEAKSGGSGTAPATGGAGVSPAWDFRTLTVNGSWRHRSFLPQTGFYEHLSVYNEPWRSTTGGGFGVVPPELKKTMIYKPEDLGGWLSTANAELIIYHSWDMSHARIEVNDVKTNTLTLTPLLGYPAGAFGIKKYKVENIKEGMHTPGLWYLDREKGQVVYWPLPGEDMTKAEVIAPVGNALIKIEGTPQKPVSDLAVRNLTLADTNVPWKSPGFGASGISDNAISLIRGQNCLLSGLHLKAIGGNGIVIYLGDRNRVSGCHLEYIGASGLKGNGTKVAGEGDNLVVEDNHLENIGMVYPGGLGMTIGNVANARILRNLIHDCGYSGICFSADK
ncbi:MAG: right-handed parallel beta-helix repeat-containing protein, partial [Bacteroidota bacterium]